MKTRRTVVWTSLVVVLLAVGGSVGARPPAYEPLATPPAANAPAALVSMYLQYQGRLTNPATGQGVSDNLYAMAFSLYNADSGGTALWTETKGVPVYGGLFSTALGDSTALPQSLFNGQALWLGVKVGADPETSPRQRILPVAYALSLVPGAISSGNSSAPILSVSQSGAGAAGYFTSMANYGVYGVGGGGSGTYGGYFTGGGGVYGQASNGYGGYFTSTHTVGAVGMSTVAAGVYGVGGGAPGTYGGYFTGGGGVYGQASNGYGGYFTSPTDDGLRGMSSGASGTYGGHFEGGGGVYGQASNGFGGLFSSSQNDGVRGMGGNVSGVYGGDFTGYGGVFGQASGGYAGFFDGPVYVLGNFSASGTKSFKIDNPLDPGNQYLYHYAVESPQVENMYNGTVTLDAMGEAEVKLPAYFSAINSGEFSYYLTAIGAPMPNLYVAQEIQGNIFKIAGGVAGKKVSWMVYGQRNDPWLRDHPAPDVVNKPTSEQGTYLYPQGYGQPETNSPSYAHGQATTPRQTVPPPPTYVEPGQGKP